MKNLIKTASAQNHRFLFKNDVAPKGGNIENGTNVYERTQQDLSALKTETAKQNLLRNQVQAGLESLKPASLLDTKITVKSRDTLGALAFGVDRAATAKYKLDNGLAANARLSKDQHKAKELNISWGTQVEFYDAKGALAKTVPLNQANRIVPGDVVSFKKLPNGETVIVVNQNSAKKTPNNSKKTPEVKKTTIEAKEKAELDVIDGNLDMTKFNPTLSKLVTNSDKFTNGAMEFTPSHYFHLEGTPLNPFKVDVAIDNSGKVYELDLTAKKFAESTKFALNGDKLNIL